MLFYQPKIDLKSGAMVGMEALIRWRDPEVGLVQMSIVTAIISLAHAIDLKVIAEGVETPTQAQLLRLLRCDQIQGYLMARPQPADDVAKLLGQTFEIPKAQKT